MANPIKEIDLYIEVAVKPCNDCGIPKSLTEFSPDKKQKDGRSGKCKTCRNKDQQVLRDKWRAEKKAKMKHDHDYYARFAKYK
jgi:hypothetical protein